MTNFVDKVEALKKSMADDPKEWWTLYEHRSFFGELCDKALEAERLRQALGYFLVDERFNVAIGGNPHAVDEMFKRVTAVYNGTGDR